MKEIDYEILQDKYIQILKDIVFICFLSFGIGLSVAGLIIIVICS